MKINVTDANFERDVIEQSKTIPVLVDFWAGWCGPCMMLGPVLENLANEFDDKMILAKAETDNNPRVSSEYGIMSIPAVKLFKGGKVVDEFIGAQPEHAIRQWLEEKL